MLSTRIVRTVINGRDTYRMQLVCDGHPTRRHPVGDGRVSFDLGPSADRGGRAACRWELVGLGGAAGRCDPVGHDTAASRAAASGSPAPRRITRVLPPRWHPHAVAASGSVPAPRSEPRSGWPSCIVGWLSIARRCTGRSATDCWATAPTSPARRLDYVSWQKNFPRSVRDRAPGLLVEMMRRKAESAGGERLYEYNPPPRPCRKPVCAGTARKSRSRNGSTAVSVASQKIGTCFRPTSDYTSEPTSTGSIGWTCSQPTRAGCVVRTSMSRRSPAVVHQHASGEAAGIRPRGGQWRASRRGVKPTP